MTGMQMTMRRFRRGRRRARYGLWAMAGLGMFVLQTPEGAHAGGAPFSARGGIELAQAAALAWAEDARLIYVENDEPVDAGGNAPRWGYLYLSPSRDKYRVYSIENGKIEVATDLGFIFDAPALPETWIDSEQAFLKAEKDAGLDFRAKHDGALESMMLVRGVLHHDEPNKATWALVYSSESSPSLFVLVDAASGNIVKKWRG